MNLKVTVPDDNKEFIEELLHKLGCETEAEKSEQNGKTIDKNISPTMLFGKWKDLDIDLKAFRKKLWRRKK